MSGEGYQVGKTFTLSSASGNYCSTCTITNSTTGGTIPAGTYSVKFTFTINGQETNINTANQTFNTTGSTSSVTFQVGSQYCPQGTQAMNVYVGPLGQESYQGSSTGVGVSFKITSISNTGRPFPIFNQTSYQDINPSSLGLPTGSTFNIHNIYYNSPIAFGIYDGTTLFAYESDYANQNRIGMDIHCNDSIWIRVFNPSSTNSLTFSFDGIQTK
jgi:hypothetical protein